MKENKNKTTNISIAGLGVIFGLAFVIFVLYRQDISDWWTILGVLMVLS